METFRASDWAWATAASTSFEATLPLAAWSALERAASALEATAAASAVARSESS